MDEIKVFTGNAHPILAQAVADYLGIPCSPHHAGRNFYGGMCYFNGAALAITALKEKGVRRFAIVDTDCHHAGDNPD